MGYKMTKFDKISLVIVLVALVVSVLCLSRLHSISVNSAHSAWVEFKTDKGYGEMLIDDDRYPELYIQQEIDVLSAFNKDLPKQKLISWKFKEVK